MRTTPESNQILLDHVDARMVAADADEQVSDRNAIVRLDPDHPGFRDAEYRARRNRIAAIALRYEPGATVPDAPYTDEEHALWRTIRDALEHALSDTAFRSHLVATQRSGPTSWSEVARRTIAVVTS